jgi:hypothetical protein
MCCQAVRHFCSASLNFEVDLMRYIILVVTLFTAPTFMASVARADYLATVISADFEFADAIPKTRVLTAYDGNWPYHVIDLGDDRVGVETTVFPHAPSWERYDKDRFVNFFIPGFWSGSTIFDVPVDQATGQYGYQNDHLINTAQASVDRLLPVAGDPAAPYVRGTWTLDSFSVEDYMPEIQANYLTRITVTGRLYIATPEPASFVLLLLAAVFQQTTLARCSRRTRHCHS